MEFEIPKNYFKIIKGKKDENEPGERKSKFIGCHVHHNRADFRAIGISVSVFRLFRAASFPVFFIEAVVKCHVLSCLLKRLNTGLRWLGIPETEDSPRKSMAMFRTNSGRGV